MPKTSYRNVLTTLILLLLTIMQLGCAGKTAPPVFYPPAPDEPRFQFLKSFSGEADAKESAFSKALAEGTFQFQKAFGVTSYKSTILVTDGRLPGYIVIDLDQQKFRFIMQDKQHRNSSFFSAFGIAVDQEGRRYIADKRARRVLIYSADDQYLRSIDFKKEESAPTAVAVGDGKLYVAHLRFSRIDIFDLTNDKLIGTIDSEQLRWPSAMDWRNNSLYVSDLLRYKVLQFNAQNELEQEYGDIGDGTGKLARPKGVAVDKDGRVLVVDSAFGNFQIFRSDKQLLGFVGKSGVMPGDMALPANIHISYELVPYFQKYAAPGFKLEYIVAVANQGGAPSRINIYGFGKTEEAK